MTASDMTELRKAMFTRLYEAVERREILQLDLISEEAKTHGQLDIALFAQARKEFLGSNFKKALELTHEILRLNPRFIAAEYLESTIHIETGQYDEAIDSINETMSKFWDNNPEVSFFNKAVVYTRIENIQAARFSYWMAILAKPTYKVAYMGLIANAASSSNWDEILMISRQIREVFAGDPKFLNEAVTRLLQVTDSIASKNPDIAKLFVEEARVMAESSLRQDPMDPGIQYNFACVMARSGNRSLAIEHLKKAIETERDNSSSARYSELARTDPDFSTLRGDPEFQRITNEIA